MPGETAAEMGTLTSPDGGHPTALTHRTSTGPERDRALE